MRICIPHSTAPLLSIVVHCDNLQSLRSTVVPALLQSIHLPVPRFMRSVAMRSVLVHPLHCSWAPCTPLQSIRFPSLHCSTCTPLTPLQSLYSCNLCTPLPRALCVYLDSTSMDDVDVVDDFHFCCVGPSCCINLTWTLTQAAHDSPPTSYYT